MAKPKKPKAKKPNLSTPGGLDPLAAWTMPQIQSWAQKQARATISPILADIDRQQQNNTANITGFSEALARTLAPLGARVGDAYQTSAGMGEAFGSGFQDGLKLLEQQGSTQGGQQVAGALAGLTSSLGGIASRALGQEGAAQQTLANTYALAPANMGQQYLRESQGRFDQQRQEVRDKLPEAAQQIIQSLLDREIQKAGLRANEQALGLDREKLVEDTRRFNVEADLKRQGLELDWAQLAAQRAEWDADRTERARKEYEKAVTEGKTEKAKAIATREKALSAAGDDVLASIEKLNSGESTVTYLSGGKWVDKVDPATGTQLYDEETGEPVKEWQPEYKTKTFPNRPRTRTEMYKALKAMYAPTLKSRYKFNDKTIELLIWNALRQSGYENIYTSAPQ